LRLSRDGGGRGCLPDCWERNAHHHNPKLYISYFSNFLKKNISIVRHPLPLVRHDPSTNLSVSASLVRFANANSLIFVSNSTHPDTLQRTHHWHNYYCCLRQYLPDWCNRESVPWPSLRRKTRTLQVGPRSRAMDGAT
jgi:hypothetical protein